MTRTINTLFILAVTAFAFSFLTECCHAQKEVIIVVGAEGESEYGTQFSTWANRWKEIANDDIHLTTIGLDIQDSENYSQLKNTLKKLGTKKSQPELWLVLIGHGTFDGELAKFNLKGKDFSAAELGQWLDPFKSQTVLINCSSCSSPFLTKLAAPNRIIVAATKSGYQYNFARFGEFMSRAIADETIDLDKDGQTSLLETFIAASAGVKEFYDSDGRLATELALLDDNADGRGTPGDWFAGTRAVKTAKTGKADGLLANQVFLVQRPGGVVLTDIQLKNRNELEVELESLRKRKNTLSEDDYYLRLEEIMLKLGAIYAAASESASTKK